MFSLNARLKLFLIFFIYFHVVSPWTRFDYVEQINTPPNMNKVPGTWQGTYECSSGWAAGYRVWNDYEYYGLIMIQIFCYDMKGVFTENTPQFITSSDFLNFGGWNTTYNCSLSLMGFLTGYTVYGCCCPHWNNLGLNNMKMSCSSGEILTADPAEDHDGDTY